MSITLSFKLIEEKTFVLTSSSTPTLAGTAEAMKKIFETKKVFEQRTSTGAIPNWDEFSAKITVTDHATNFRLQLTSKDNKFVYDLTMMTPKTAESLISSEELKKLRSPLPAQLPPPQSAMDANPIAPHPTMKLPCRNMKESFITQLRRFFSFHAYQLFCGLNTGFKLAVSFLFKS
jgi:hypothetical protein